MEKLKVIYVGNDQEYWKNLKDAFSRDYQNLEVTFLEKSFSESFHPPQVFMDIYHEQCDVIYVDLAFMEDKGLSLCKLLCRNNETRLKSVVGLHSHRKSQVTLYASILTGVRLNYIKSVEFDDVIYHPLSLLDATSRPPMRYAEGKALNKFVYSQILRIGYIADDHFRVETNSPLEEEEIIELDQHPLQNVMEANRFYVQNYNDSDLYYNQRFSYNLKYTYVESGFFRASEQTWLKYKNEREEIRRKELEFIEQDVNRRRLELKPVKEEIRQWVEDNQSKDAAKRLKVLVIDETLDIFKEYDGNLDNFAYTINFQTRLTKDFYQIRRSRPHLIVFHYEENGNNRDVLKKVMEKVKSLENYHPAILVFNCHDNSEVLRSLSDYDHIVAYKETVKLDTIKKMSKILDQRFHITDPEGKLFLKTSDPRSVATFDRTGKIIKFNESELFFESRYKIPMWTTFIMKEPLIAMITVIPHEQSLAHTPGLNVYRALINGDGETQKKKLRQLVNSSLQ